MTEDNQISVLDCGLVRLVDHMGDDSSIVQAARTSYGKGTKSSREDTALIRYLMRHRHTTPFEMVEFKLHIKCPIFVARQWLRHRTASVNEYSLRYSEAKDEFYVPDIEKIGIQDTNNKQGTVSHDDSEARQRAYEVFECYGHRTNLEGEVPDPYLDYRFLIGECKVSREQARIILPVSSYTEFYWKINLHNLFNFLNLRMDEHAQFEIREFANAVAELVKPVVPAAWKAFEDYILYAETFSAQELDIIRQMADSYDMGSCRKDGMSDREWKEFKDKLQWLEPIPMPVID